MMYLQFKWRQTLVENNFEIYIPHILFVGNVILPCYSNTCTYG